MTLAIASPTQTPTPPREAPPAPARPASPAASFADLLRGAAPQAPLLSPSAGDLAARPASNAAPPPAVKAQRGGDAARPAPRTAPAPTHGQAGTEPANGGRDAGTPAARDATERERDDSETADAGDTPADARADATAAVATAGIAALPLAPPPALANPAGAASGESAGEGASPRAGRRASLAHAGTRGSAEVGADTGSAAPASRADAGRTLRAGAAAPPAADAFAALHADRDTAPPADAAASTTAAGQTITAADPTASGPAAPPLTTPLTTPLAPRSPQAAAAAERTPPREARIAVALGEPGFAGAVGTTLAVLARDGVHEARLQLHPAEMGPITVQIALDGSSARVDFHAAVAATRQALESALPALAGALRESGLTLTGGGVHQQAPGQQDPSCGRDDDGGFARGRGETSDAAAALAPLRVARRGLVDLVA